MLLYLSAYRQFYIGVKLMKIFAPKTVDRVNIYPLKEVKLTEKLQQAKGVMNNYLKDKHFSVSISQCPLDEECLQVKVISDTKKSMSRVSVKKEGDIPLLRKIYTVIETFAKDSYLNARK